MLQFKEYAYIVGVVKGKGNKKILEAYFDKKEK